MKQILDLENKSETKSSWKPVLITNGVLVLLVILFFMIYAYLGNSYIKVPLIIKVYFTLFLIIVCIICFNILLTLLSFFFSKFYWKKWLIMAVIGVVLFIITIFIQLIIDISKFDFSV